MGDRLDWKSAGFQTRYLQSSNLWSPAKFASDAEAVEARDCKPRLTRFKSVPALQEGTGGMVCHWS